MSYKHVVENSKALIDDVLNGLDLTNSEISVDKQHRVAHLATIPKNRVALISGGGSGHEPAHAGFVGGGLLSAAACGNIFVSINLRCLNEV